MLHRVRSLVLSACASLLLLTGCSESSPTAVSSPLSPAQGATMARGPGSSDFAGLARFDEKPSVSVAWAKKWIGPEGGRLDFHGFAIDVPTGAVDRVTQFSIRLPVDPHGSERVVAEFGPHGTTFEVPVTIELPYAGTSVFGEEATIVWKNSREGTWEEFATQITDDGLRLKTTTTHFSVYGTRRSGGLLASGG